MNDFTHLHLHTEFSLLDSAIRIPELIQYLKENNMSACAITDHGVMSGIVDFYKECRKEGIKSLIGCESYITRDPDNTEKKTRDNMHMVLIAKDNIGLSRLSETISTAALENFYYKPRIYIENLKYLSDHCIATTACLGSCIAKSLEWEKDSNGNAVACSDPEGLVEKDLNFYLDVFGDDFYLELQVWNDETNHQQVYNQWLLNFGRERGLPFIIAADCHYLREEDYKMHEIMMAMQIKKTLDDYRSNSNFKYGPHFYVATPKEMLRRSKEINCEEAFWNTIKVRDKCNVDIELGKLKEPIFDITKCDDYEEFKKEANDEL